MATFNENPPLKFKLDFQDPVTGTKFSEEPLLISNYNISADPNGRPITDVMTDLNEALNELCSLTGASCTAKHLIYDYTITD